jgi:uncharacterized 2Fe-2S/4Fe-4S cluster protein (DUF4445 family)
MAQHKVVFAPLQATVTVETGTTLLEAAGKAHITIDSACGGDGICGRCKMIVRQGRVGGHVSSLLTREEVRQGMVLACQTPVEDDLLVEIPESTRAVEKVVVDRDAQRFRAARPGIRKREFEKSPLVTKTCLRVDPPSLDNSLADCQRVQTWIRRATGISSIQAGLKVIRRMPEVLREGDFTVTAIVGGRRDVAELMDLEPGDTSRHNVMAIVDAGTSTVVAHLVDAVAMTTVGTQACFNSQATYGREVTARMMAAEKHGLERLQTLLVENINELIASLTAEHKVHRRDITAVVCAGNTAMMHFLLGLPTRNIRRAPYVAVTVEPPPFRAAEVGIRIHPRGLLFAVPGIGGWVGGDLTAGILATGLHESEGIGMLVDIGTNGEIILGNKDWLMACSASAGPALEGAGLECGMMAVRGAIERVYLFQGEVHYDVIGNGPPDGICGSGVIDLIATLLSAGVIDRAGRLVEGSSPRVRREHGRWKFVLAEKDESLRGREICVYQEDLDNVITAKAAIFAAAKIMFERLDLKFSDIDRLMIAGGFGSYINPRNAIMIGLLPDLPLSKVMYVGNTAIWGAKLAAFSREARTLLRDICQSTTYYDLMGTEDYVEQFRQAMFLPHTDIELFPSALERPTGRRGGR